MTSSIFSVTSTLQDQTDLSKLANPVVNIPRLTITLPNEIKAETELKHFEANINPHEKSSFLNRADKIKHPSSCNYIGHFKGDVNSVVAVSGCLHMNKVQHNNESSGAATKNRKKLQVTVLSNATNITKFVVDEFGNLTEVTPDGISDIVVGDEHYPNLSSWSGYRYLNGIIQDNNIPKEINLHLGMGYDKSVKEYFEDYYSVEDAFEKIEEWMSDILNHMQAYVWLSSMKTKINLKEEKDS